MIGKCGDNCACCPRYLATRSGRDSELAAAKDLWVRLGLRKPDFPLEAMACCGCRQETPCAYEDLRACVDSKSLANCGACDEYPCQGIQRVFDKTERLKARAMKVCTQQEMEMLAQAFFAKKEILGRTNC